MEPVPHVQVRGSRAEVLQLFHSLDETGRLALFAPSQVRMPLRAGLFCLMKNLEKDRLIMDARPANLAEEPLNAWTQSMGCATPLLDMVLPPDRIVLAAGEDLQDYYYFYKVSRDRAARNALAFLLTAEEARRFKSFAQVEEEASHYVPALNTMAMGDLNSVEFGQQAHMKLALRAGVKLGDCITLRGRMPRQSWAVGIVIDDLIVLEQVPRDQPVPAVSSQLADKMVQQYIQVGLKPHAGKRFREQVQSQFWDTSLDGETGIIRAQLERVVPIAVLTAQLARTGYADRKLLEVLTGAWVSILQMRRRCMCLLEEVFLEIQRCEYGQIFKLPTKAVDELWTMVVLAPLFCSDLRAQIVPELALVDASDKWEAEVVTPVEPALAAELARQKLSKASWSRLLSPWKALQKMHGILPPESEVPEGQQPARSHPLWKAVVKSKCFSLIGRKKVKRRTHINLSELSAALASEARRSRKSPNTRLLLGSDNQVVLGALVRGRASSSSLNQKLRRHLPWLLAYNTYPAVNYVNTADNVADDPTRDRSCREPESAPDWCSAAAEGNFEKVDQVLAAHAVDDNSIARLPAVLSPTHGPLDPVSRRAALRRDYALKRSTRTGGRGNADTTPVTRRVEPWIRAERLSSSCQQLLGSLPSAQFVVPAGKKLEELLKWQGHLDLFSGKRGAAKALAEATGQWVLTFDIAHHASENLLDQKVQDLLHKLVSFSAFLSVGAGPVCASFSRAVRPPVRTKDCPTGLDGISENMQEKVTVGNAMSRWLAGFIHLVHSFGICWWVENPAGSYLWWQPEWVDLVRSLSLKFFTTHYCRWGTPWRKRTRFLTSASIAGETLLCRCERPHVRLVGYSKSRGCCLMKAAEAYPTGLCRFLAKVISEELKPEERRQKLDVASCAKCCGRRIGEASNPGPRPRRAPPVVDLGEVDTVAPSTRLLQLRALERYAKWLTDSLPADVIERFWESPSFQASFLQSFGHWHSKMVSPCTCSATSWFTIRSLFLQCACSWRLLGIYSSVGRSYSQCNTGLLCQDSC